MIQRGRRLALAAFSLLFIAALGLSPLLAGKAHAAGTLEPRSLTLEANGTTGGSLPGGTVKYLFQFTTATTGNIGSINFQFCTTAGGTCTAPVGLDVHSATLTAQGANANGFTIHTPTVSNSDLYITRTAANVNSGLALSYEFSNVVNPTAANTSFYVHINTYSSIDTTGSPLDTGTVAASTANAIVLTGVMPESLIFCTGATISNTGGVPDCSTATAGNINFNQDFSPADTATATSQMAASTNANSGYAITVNGATLTSGTNTVTPMTTSASGDLGVRGTSQFGMNLEPNTTTTSTPAVGSAIAPANNAANYEAEALTGYASIDHFRFVSGQAVADSTSKPTDIETYTVSYIVNVNGAQAVGTYTTTLTYICTPTF